eukprot:CAMPEP_0179325060 /NCGR_PEP_ID=MMETSP0797-20121207/60652_1 /TAXON_ID=47934 /ORGANISM="Dinophysis acuminata, Strain DAEP01" /LENGTH=94 /DNA_ID=CAMNT_0021037143 /DNA_START=65 /DNA_END=346 /DNA_ORIENTATION=+
MPAAGAVQMPASAARPAPATPPEIIPTSATSATSDQPPVTGISAMAATVPRVIPRPPKSKGCGATADGIASCCYLGGGWGRAAGPVLWRSGTRG